ncbi:MAG: hypothetical protein KC478_10080, partial [Bacteriovoracaceae bacterium]|nr:hypothetical protein [Bacteriovoracaceae bacterium]
FNGLETLDFQIYTDEKKKNILKDTQDTSNDNDLITGRFKVNGENTLTEQAYVDLTLPGTIQESGMYSDTYIVNLYYNWRNTYYLADTTTMNFNYLVPEIISLSLVDSGAPHDPNDTSQILDFGIMETSERLSFDIVVKASDGYNLKFSSLNNGKLQHNAGNFFVDYSALIDGSSVDLAGSSSSPVLVKTSPSATGDAGDRTSVSITLGSVEGKVAGSYRDSVTITVESAL